MLSHHLLGSIRSVDTRASLRTVVVERVRIQRADTDETAAGANQKNSNSGGESSVMVL